MEKIFGKASDKYVGSVVFYVGSGKIYTTSDKDTLAATDDLVHAFKMGTLLLDNSGVLGRPLAISTSGTPVQLLQHLRVLLQQYLLLTLHLNSK